MTDSIQYGHAMRGQDDANQPLSGEPLVGRALGGRFRIEQLIARGGMGKVYRATQLPLQRPVVVKVLDPAYTGQSVEEFHQRFFLEASLCSKLRHPNTVTIFDYGQAGDVYYIVMEYLEGRTLTQAMFEEGPFRPGRVVHVGMQLCRSLREAHAMGIVHRDLKPANIFLMHHEDRDEDDFVKVLDFGLVKRLSDVQQEGLTRVGSIMGSPGYMAPEQIRGGVVDHRADIYVLGCLLFEMLTGRTVFPSATTVGVLRSHVEEPVPSLLDAKPDLDVPPALEGVIRRCLAKRPEDRFSNMGQVLAELKIIARSMIELAWLANEDSAVVMNPLTLMSERSVSVVRAIPAPSPRLHVVPHNQAHSDADANPVALDIPHTSVFPEQSLEIDLLACADDLNVVSRHSASASPDQTLPLDAVAHAVPKIHASMDLGTDAAADRTLTFDGLEVHAPTLILPSSDPLVRAAWQAMALPDDEQTRTATPDEDALPPPQQRIRWGRAIAMLAASVIVGLTGWEGYRRWHAAQQDALSQAPTRPVPGAANLEMTLESQPAGAMVMLDQTKICDATPCAIMWLGDPAIVNDGGATAELKRFHFVLPAHQQVQLQKHVNGHNRVSLHAVLQPF